MDSTGISSKGHEPSTRPQFLLREVIEANDQYRALVSKQLYDSTAQALGAVLLHAGSAMRSDTLSPTELRMHLREVYEMASATLEEVRRLSHLLYPRVLEELGLEAALLRLARDANASSEGQVRLSVHVDAATTIPSHLAIPLFWAAQASVHVAQRYEGRADMRIDMSIWLSVRTSEVRLEILDETGVLDVKLLRQRAGRELRLARERVLLAEGQFLLEPRTGGGGSVVVVFPIPAKNLTPTLEANHDE